MGAGTGKEDFPKEVMFEQRIKGWLRVNLVTKWEGRTFQAKVNSM